MTYRLQSYYALSWKALGILIAPLFLWCCFFPLLLGILLAHTRLEKHYMAVFSLFVSSYWLASLCFLVGDLLALAELGKHLGHETLLTMHSDFSVIFGTGVTYLLQPGRVYFWIIALAFALLLAWFWLRHIVHRRIKNAIKNHFVHASIKKTWLFWLYKLGYLLGAAFVMLILIRGIDEKPLGMVHAFESGRYSGGLLRLNAIFTLSRAWLDPQKMHAMPQDSAASVRVNKELLKQPHMRFLEPHASFHRRLIATHSHKQKPNIVLVMLESWGNVVASSVRMQQGLRTHKDTPHFDALVAQGKLFTRFYASGSRSIDGFSTVISGLLQPPGVGYFGLGSELTRGIHWLGSLFAQQGYKTYFIQTSHGSLFLYEKHSAVSRL